MQHNQTPTRIPRQPVVRARGLAAAVRKAARRPESLVEVFLADWAEVDRARVHVAAIGLAGRIAVHHEAALASLRRLRILPALPGAPVPEAPAPQTLKRFLEAISVACGDRMPRVMDHPGDPK